MSMDGAILKYNSQTHVLNKMVEKRAKIYFDENADLASLRKRVVAIIGYGNQGRAWALNLRDSGVKVVVGNVKDKYRELAESEGFEVHDIGEASEIGDVVCLLLPDVVQPKVYESEIKECLEQGDALVFAHGFAIHYGQIRPPNYVDVLLVAPRMIGVGVRSLYVKGKGAPALMGVGQDATGNAREVALALCKALGFTKAGVVESSFKEETELDLFSEQAVWPGINGILMKAYEILVSEGYSPEAVTLELLASGEIIEVAKQIVSMGLMKQLELHSTTSQYGQLSRMRRFIDGDYVKRMIESLREIQNGYFAKEWLIEQTLNYPVFNKLVDEAMRHPINEAHERIKNLMRIDYDVY
jgi:ketol-acid reductoisomerase